MVTVLVPTLNRADAVILRNEFRWLSQVHTSSNSPRARTWRRHCCCLYYELSKRCVVEGAKYELSSTGRLIRTGMHPSCTHARTAHKPQTLVLLEPPSPTIAEPPNNVRKARRPAQFDLRRASAPALLREHAEAACVQGVVHHRWWISGRQGPAGSPTPRQGETQGPHLHRGYLHFDTFIRMNRHDR